MVNPVKFSRGVILLCSISVSSLVFHSYRPRYLSGHFRLRMDNSQTDSKHSTEFTNEMEAKNYEVAFKILKRNPMLTISKNDGVTLLNNIAQLNPNDDNYEKNQKQVCARLLYLMNDCQFYSLLFSVGCGIKCVYISKIGETKNIKRIWMYRRGVS